MFLLILVIYLSEALPWILNDFVLSISVIDGTKLDNLTHREDWSGLLEERKSLC